MSAILKDCFSLSFQNMKGPGVERGKLPQPQLSCGKRKQSAQLGGASSVEVRRQQDRPHLFRPLGKVLGKFARSGLVDRN
jgi:hypothetical protein